MGTSPIVLGLEGSLTAAERAQKEADERNDALIQSRVDLAAKTGPVPREIGDSGKLLATFDQLKDTKAYATGDRPFIQPIGYKVDPSIPGGFRWVLTDADEAAVVAGFACQRCLDYYPSTWTPACPSCFLER